jgi:hypothetical protein
MLSSPFIGYIFSIKWVSTQKSKHEESNKTEPIVCGYRKKCVYVILRDKMMCE